MRIHIILNRDLLVDPKATHAVLRRIQEVTGLTSVNQQRFDRYGILTGDTDLTDLDVIRTLPGVDAVEEERRRWIAPW
jgi:hypothetical protein